jgi:diacylglycerol kinase (ATP)
MSQKKIVFILNPISGVNQKSWIEQEIQENIDKVQYDYHIVYTDYAGHATLLAQQAVKDGFDVVIAVGGDGSVNEVAAALIGTDVKMGILPAGSGNGFAMHLGIGRKVKKALKIINDGYTKTIDTCTLNGRPYVNLAGLGFDAKIAYRYKRVKKRGFWGYFKFSLEETLKFDFPHYTVKIDGKEVINRTCLSVVVANAPMYGYGFVIAPKALLNDGKLEIVVFYKAKMWRYFLSLWRMITHSMHHTSLADRFSGKEVEVTFFDEETYAHLDGEGFVASGKQLFKVVPNSLKVIMPKEK